MNVLSLFSGIGGLDLGLKIAVPTARNVCYVEANEYCQRVLAARMLDGSLDAAPIHGDVTTFDGRPWRGSVDTICGGFPCQDISNAGRREGIGGKRSGLWSEFARLVDEIRPRYVFVENVGALLVRGLDTVLGDLASLGFDAEWLCLSAAEVGAPHLRKRVFILAHSQNGYDGRQVADAQCGRLRQQSERGGIASPSRACNGFEDVADASESGRRKRFTDLPGEPQSDAAGCSDALADAEGQRGELWAAEGGGPGGSASGGSAVGHADDEGLEGRRLCRCGRADEWPPRQTCLPSFPPGPAERDAWAAILAERPDFAPAVERGVRGVDARLSRRVDRLKALGNAVVPMQAAAAFRLLAGRIGE